MLKTRVGNEVWLVHQPDHARVAGYLAAHWGSSDGFAHPGQYAPSPIPDLLRQEVVQAIAEHDNGWWEWEADPAIDPLDHWPRHLTEVAKERADAGLERWRAGVPRLAEQHPYIALLISLHAYWLYAFAFDDLEGLDTPLRHPLFGVAGKPQQLVTDRPLTRAFLAEQQALQLQLAERLRSAPAWASAVEPPQLLPNVRLLQLLDAIALLISFGGERPATFSDVPRGSWQDRISMTWQPTSARQIVCDPYPFDLDPLPVYLNLRIVPYDSATPQPAGEGVLPLVTLLATPIITIRFELVSQQTAE